MNILIAGATGGIGKRLTNFLYQKGYIISTLGRNPDNAKEMFHFSRYNFSWEDNWEEKLPEIDAIINLSGATIGKRWSKKYKEEIYKSRIETTRRIVEKLNNFSEKKINFFNTSAIGIYSDSNDNFLDENSEPGNGFLSKVCVDWETEALKVHSNHKLVIGRFGVVLKEDDIALKRILFSYKFGFGVVIGTGYQWFSWIHIDDLLNLIYKSITEETFSGVYNFVAPAPVRFRDFIQTIGKILNKPFILSIPDYLINLAFGEQSTILLSSQRVIPKRLMEINYEFKYPKIEEALRSIIS
ncbi:MAG: TIGR01777 family oxidoreductase [Ignavibacteria bacterium]|nr:TIGR01777 family oxidoreductase [Ignavibacteria bacterium]